MLKLKGFMSVCALLVVSSIATAELRIIVDGEVIPAGTVEDIVILPDVNELIITTTASYEISVNAVGDGVAITGFSVSPGAVEEGSNATISWSTDNAVSCTPTGGTGGWSSVDIASIGLASGSTVIAATTAGTYTFTLSCDGSEVGDTTETGFNLTVTAPGAIDITSFTASPNTINEGGTTTLSWATKNAVSCTPSGGTDGWSSVDIAASGLANGSTVITATTSGSYTFTLSCLDASGAADVRNASVTVNAVVGSCETPGLSGKVVDWAGVWGYSFPGPVYKTKDITVTRYGYYAMKFNTGNVIDEGKLLAIENSVTNGIILGAISECPGDFDVEPACDYAWGLGGDIEWSTNNKFRTCKLQDNTDYYFNITFTDGNDPTETTCDRVPCIATMEHRNY